MGLYAGLRAVAGASGSGAVDWDAAAEAAKRATPAGELTLSDADRAGYADDVRAAREALRPVAGVDFEVPRAVTVQHRHHWIDANVVTFRRLLAPLDDRVGALPGVARVANTGSIAASLAFLARHVLGQYDPVLLAAEGDHELYVVHPNVVGAADALGVPYERFRRWILFHEVAHAAEFGAAPWLADYLGERAERSVEALAAGSLRTDPLRELDLAMTAVEGYAELLMDRAFDREYADLRAKLESRRRGRDPLTRLLGRLFGVGMKRRQYERGKAFFEAVADARDLEAASAVWDDPANLPTRAELDDPTRWLARVE